MRRNVKSDPVIKAITSATAGMLALMTSISSMPMTAFADIIEVESAGETLEIDTDNLNDTTDSDNHDVIISEGTPVEQFVVDNDEPTSEAPADTTNLTPGTPVTTYDAVATEKYILKDGNGDNVIGVTADGETKGTIEVEGPKVESEEVDVLIKEADGSIIEVETVSGYFDETGLFVEVTDETKVPEGVEVKKYAVNADKTIEYTNETTTVTKYTDKEGTDMYLTDESYDEKNLHVDTVYTITTKAGEEVVVETEKVQAKEVGKLLVYLGVEKRENGNHYDLVNETLIDFPELAPQSVHQVDGSGTGDDNGKGHNAYAYFDYKGERYYIPNNYYNKAGQTEAGHTADLKVGPTSYEFQITVGEKTYVVDKKDITATTTYTITYGDKVLGDKLTETQKNDIINSIGQTSYTLVADKIKITSVDGDVYIPVEYFQAVVEHHVTVTATTTYYYETTPATPDDVPAAPTPATPAPATPAPAVDAPVVAPAVAAPAAAPAAVLGANRPVEEVAEAAPAAVLGARRDNGGAVLGARRDANTGDMANFGMYAAVLSAAAFAGAGYTLLRRKNDDVQ